MNDDSRLAFARRVKEIALNKPRQYPRVSSS